MANRLIVGCGYVGSRAAKLWREAGDRVLAFTRTGDRAALLQSQGIEPILWDWVSDAIMPRLPVDQIDTILISVSHSSVPGITPSQTHTIGLDHLLNDIKSQFGEAQLQLDDTRWIYLSTTGVYGPSHSSTRDPNSSSSNDGGLAATHSQADWVDEETEVNPTSAGAIAAWYAEQWLSDRLIPETYTILRPAGIYGPDRVPRWQALRDSIPLEVDPMSYLNLIHVDDLAAIIVRVADRRMRYSLYCVSDGTPVLRRDYYNHISATLQLPDPIFAERDTSNSSISHGSTTSTSTGKRGSGNKRVSNHRLRNELQFKFLYPTFREGIHDLFAKATT